MNAFRLFSLLLMVLSLASICHAQRRGGGGRGVSVSGEHSLTFGLGMITSDQDDLNDVITEANASGSGNVDKLTSGMEYFVQYGIRFDRSWWGFVFRPSMMTQSSSGTVSGANHKVEVTGMAFFPMIRMVPLENDLIKLFFQFGLGYGEMSGRLKQGSNSVKFEGSAFGSIAGLGVDFCFSASHCITVEGNLRYLPIERNLITSGSTTGMTGVNTGIGAGGELERQNLDVATTMSGVQGLVSYTLFF